MTAQCHRQTKLRVVYRPQLGCYVVADATFYLFEVYEKVGSLSAGSRTLDPCVAPRPQIYMCKCRVRCRVTELMTDLDVDSVNSPPALSRHRRAVTHGNPRDSRRPASSWSRVFFDYLCASAWEINLG
jgi:hypothetical protein